MASPLSAPGSPRTSSPLNAEHDTAQALSSSPDDAHTLATHKEADHGWPGHLAVPNAAQPLKHAPKGKEKAVRGPLRLLDLPVDILKEIIHQVCLAYLRIPVLSSHSV